MVNEDVDLRSKPGVGVMPGSPQGSSRVPGNSGRVLSAWYQSLGSISCGPHTLCASLSCGIMMGSVTGRHRCHVPRNVSIQIVASQYPMEGNGGAENIESDEMKLSEEVDGQVTREWKSCESDQGGS
ncbi:unnamed protein product [Prunus armeniaca]